MREPCGKDDDYKQQIPAEDAIVMAEPEQGEISTLVPSDSCSQLPESVDEVIQKRTGDAILNGQIDGPDVPLRFNEKKRLHWTGKTCRRH